MIEVHFIVPSEVTSKLSSRFSFRHKNGFAGYFVSITRSELWSIAMSLVDSGYRIDIKPGDTIRLMAKENK